MIDVCSSKLCFETLAKELWRLNYDKPGAHGRSTTETESCATKHITDVH